LDICLFAAVDEKLLNRNLKCEGFIGALAIHNSLALITGMIYSQNQQYDCRDEKFSKTGSY